MKKKEEFFNLESLSDLWAEDRVEPEIEDSNTDLVKAIELSPLLKLVKEIETQSLEIYADNPEVISALLEMIKLESIKISKLKTLGEEDPEKPYDEKEFNLLLNQLEDLLEAKISLDRYN